HGVPLCFFGEKKRTRTGSWPLLSYAPWVLQLLSEFAGQYGYMQHQKALGLIHFAVKKNLNL
ncbi:hypothetical protein, partial [Aeromonas sp. QDB25]|uniref:hypothetical protein n=1 Tax=Aeromonas sp. QDB25 TaxID=2989832 RepID=UPI0022E65BF8